MTDWLPLVFQIVSIVGTIIGAIAMVMQRITRLETRIDSLASEIRRDRELYEHRIRQLEIGLGQVRNELTRLSYQVGAIRPQPQEQHP